MTKLYSAEELKRMQAEDILPLSDSEEMATKYADKWEVADDLMNRLDADFFYKFNSSKDDDPPRYEKWENEEIPHKSYSHKYGGPVFSCDFDYMIGPEDWNDSDDKPKVGDYVLRKKIYIYNWSREHYNMQEHRDPALEYLMDMHDTFRPIHEHYAQECFSDQSPDIKFHLFKLMLIQYSTPTANDSNRVDHRWHNTDRFGPDHCDETLAGLHMGENYAEFEAQLPTSGEWVGVSDLTKDKLLFMFGEHSERSGWKPTFHRMAHNPDPRLGTRYSLIMDLQARYKGDD